ncbi:hypothetical protein [Lewinella cohaerens]|uniref:hypothetical protein n=1 Tax=Lewinella cohaerens TaxID=70995 RepID=UPI0012EB88A1|nr:hypothetical protein [Lewinella cohaerens]
MVQVSNYSMVFRTMVFVLLTLFSFQVAQAQMGIVVGINGHQLVKVNLETGELTPMRDLKGLPEGTELRNLVYIPRDTAFYSTMNFRSNPELIKIRATGAWERVGVFTAENKSIYFCEGLTYDETNDLLYLSASLDGTIQQDKVSEAILTVNRKNANCVMVATLRQEPPPNDFDEIAMFQGRLFGLDGLPDRKTTYIYPFSPAQFDGRELFAGTKQNIPYFTMDDVVVVGQLLYFPDHKTQGWYFFDLLARRWHQVGQLHGPAAIRPIKLTGLAYLPLAQA